LLPEFTLRVSAQRIAQYAELHSVNRRIRA